MKAQKLSCRVFKALCNETRLGIVVTLLDKERCACDFSKIVHKAQPTVSLQLKYLADAGIIQSRRAGKSVIYRLSDASKIRKLLACV